MKWGTRKTLGHVVIWTYWTSFVWLPAPFYLMGVRPEDHPLLARGLEIHYTPFMTMLPRMAPVFAPAMGWSLGLIMAAPLLAILVGGLCCSGLWWVSARIMERRQRGGS